MCPTDFADAGEIAAPDEIEEQIVPLDQSPWSAGLHGWTQLREIAKFVPSDFDARERYTMAKINLYLPARLLYFAERTAIVLEFQRCDVIAQAPATATIVPRVFRSRGFLALIVARLRVTFTIQLALEIAATLVAADALHGVAHRLAYPVPFPVSALAGTRDVDRPAVLLRIVRA